MANLTQKQYNQKLKTFRETFQAGDKVLLTENGKIGYVTRKTPDYVWTMYYDDTQPDCLGYMGFRYEGLDLLEKVKTNRYNLSEKHYQMIENLTDEDEKRYGYRFRVNLQFNKAFQVNISIGEICEKGFYTNKERLPLLCWLSKQTKKNITEFLDFNKNK